MFGSYVTERDLTQLVDDAHNIRRSRLHERGNRPGVHDVGGGHDSARESPLEVEFVIRRTWAFSRAVAVAVRGASTAVTATPDASSHDRTASAT